jgi:hypothetical protein
MMNGVRLEIFPAGHIARTQGDDLSPCSAGKSASPTTGCSHQSVSIAPTSASATVVPLTMASP